MPRQWRGLPLTTDPRILAKAPTYNDYLEQQHDTENRGGFFLPRIPHQELPIATAILDAIPDAKAMGHGSDKWEVWRYPTGLAVKGPSGWTFMLPLDLPKKGKGAETGAALGESEPATPVKAKRARAKA
jgi:hypothetical protein